MLEIVIILCLAGALFLLLRHYPQARQTKAFINKEKVIELFKHLPKLPKIKREKIEEKIQDSIDAGHNKIAIPVEVPEKIMHNLEPDVADCIKKADEALESNDLRCAEECSIDAISKDKRCFEAYNIIGKVAFSRGQFSDAKEAFKTAIKCDSEYGEPYYYIGVIEVREENMSKAIEHLEKAIVYEKGNAEWYCELGKAYMEVRQYAKAAKVLKRATSLDIDNKEYRDLSTEAEEKQRTHSQYSRYK